MVRHFIFSGLYFLIAALCFFNSFIFAEIMWTIGGTIWLYQAIEECIRRKK